MKRNSVYLAFILGFIALAIYFWEAPNSLLERFSQDEAASAVPPYAIVNSASSKHFDKEGKLDYSFKAETLRYFREEIKAEGKVTLQNYTEVDKPRLVIYHDGQPWLLEAAYGKFTEDNQHLLLWDNVIVTNIIGPERQTTLSTEKLEIKPEEKYAYTEEPVKISAPSGEVSATGMIANFTEKQITLLSDVRGSHDPVL